MHAGADRVDTDLLGANEEQRANLTSLEAVPRDHLAACIADRLAGEIVGQAENVGRFKEALEDFDALLQEDPGYIQAIFNRAMAYQGCGRFADAIRDLETYLELTSPHEDDYYLVAKRNLILLKGLLEERDI